MRKKLFKLLSFDVHFSIMLMRLFTVVRYSQACPKCRSSVTAEEDSARQDRQECSACGWSQDTIPGVIHRLCKDDAT